MFNEFSAYPQVDLTSSVIPFGYLYVTTIRLPGEPVRYYGGQKNKPEFDPAYLGSGTVVCDLIKQGKKEFLTVEVRTFHYSKRELDQAEKDLIAELRMFHGDACVNISDGGSFCLTGDRNPMSRPEVAAKVSAAQRGKKLSPEHRANVAAALRGKKQPNISVALNRPDVKAKHAANISAALRGKKRPDISAARRGKKLSPEQVANMAAAKRANAAAAKPFRDRWHSIKHLHPGVKTPRGPSGASIWEAFLASLPEVA